MNLNDDNHPVVQHMATKIESIRRDREGDKTKAPKEGKIKRKGKTYNPDFVISSPLDFIENNQHNNNNNNDDAIAPLRAFTDDQFQNNNLNPQTNAAAIYKTDNPTIVATEPFVEGASGMKDKIKAKTNKAIAIGRTIIGYIQSPITIIDSISNSIADLFCMTIFQKSTSKDHNLVKENTVKFLSALLSMFAVYNWFFLMFYRNIDGKDSKGENIDVAEFTREGLLEYNVWLFYFFEFAVLLLEKLNYYLLFRIPAFLSKYFNPGQLMVILYFTLFASYVSWFTYANETFTLATSGGSNMFIVLASVYVFFQLITGWYLVQPNISSVVRVVKIVSSPYLSAFFGLIRLIIVMSTNVILGIIMMYYYILIYSLFAMVIYGDDKLKVWETIKKISNYIEKSSFAPDTMGECFDMSWGEWFMHKFKKLLLILYMYIYEISFFIMFLTAAFQYNSVAEDSSLKKGMVATNGVFCVIIAIIIYLKFMYLNKEKNEKRQSPEFGKQSRMEEANARKMAATRLRTQEERIGMRIRVPDAVAVHDTNTDTNSDTNSDDTQPTMMPSPSPTPNPIAKSNSIVANNTATLASTQVPTPPAQQVPSQIPAHQVQPNSPISPPEIKITFPNNTPKQPTLPVTGGNNIRFTF